MKLQCCTCGERDKRQDRPWTIVQVMQRGQVRDFKAFCPVHTPRGLYFESVKVASTSE